jgi:hypothetical protein
VFYRHVVKGSDDGVLHLGLLAFWVLSIVFCSKTQTGQFPTSSKTKGAHTLLVPLEGANLKGFLIDPTEQVTLSFHLTLETGQFCVLEQKTMDEVKKLNVLHTA